MSDLSPYERRALAEIDAWRNPPRTWWAATTELIGKPIDAAGDLVLSVPGAELVIEKTIGGLLSLLNDAAQWSVRPEAIYAEYRDKGHTAVRGRAAIHALDLKEVEATLGWLATKYKGLAGVEGGGAGAAGLPGIPVDILALVTLNLRAIGEYATYYGFDVAHQQERLYAMQILGLASSPTDASKQVAMAQLIKIAGEVARKKTWKELERHLFVQMIQQIAKALGLRLTKQKLAQVVPATGALVGAGFNSYYTSKVCTAAFHLYRERFLAEKHGPHILPNAT